MKQSVITIGSFDGVHKGHQVILKKLVDIANKHNLKSVVISFEFPVKYVDGLITTPKEKINILSGYNINKIIILPVNKKIISITADKFFEDILVKQLKTKHIVVGYDCSFGKDRQGNISWLKEKVKEYNIKLTVIKPVKINNEIVSSSKIRNLLKTNKIEIVNKMLQRNFEITGRHISGNKIGRTLGFPTLNIETDKKKLLPMGVFSCKVLCKNKEYLGVLNIGLRPTINLKKHFRSIEVHLINFTDIWKQKQIKLYLNKFIRKEQKFKNLNILKQFIKKDIEFALKNQC